MVDIGAKRTLGEGRQALAQILKQQPDTQAVFCSSDLLALGVVAEAQARGLRIPEQLSVVGFGDAPYVADMVPSLTTVSVNGAQVGAQAARQLIQRAEGGEVLARVTDVGFAIVERDTT
jgi:LacI family gluconate utilization system Gnt-I transcriptional repressor